MRAVLKITYHFADKSGSSYPVETTEEFWSDSQALDRAEKLIDDEDRRRKKTPYKAPALTNLSLRCEDDSTLNLAQIRRIAPRVLRD